MKHSIIAAAVLTASFVTAQSAWLNLDGKPSPGVSADTWLNVTEADPSEALAGKVWLLEFFATT